MTRYGLTMDRLTTLARRLRASPLARNTVTYTFNFGLQLVIQFGYFMLVSRYLGPAGYGVFVTLSSVGLIGVLLIGLGADHLMIQRVAVHPEQFPRYFGHAVTMILLTLPVVGLAAIAIGYGLAGDALAIAPIVAIAVSHMVCGRLVGLSANAFMAFDRAREQLFVNVLIATMRLAFLGLAILVEPELTLAVFAWWYLAASALSAAVAVTLVVILCGRPKPTIVREDLKLGLQFCLEYVAIGGVGDLDKPVVAETLGDAAAGQYAAGFKIVDAASAPVRALLYATYTRHFRNAAQSRSDSVRFGIRLLPVSLAMSACVAVALFVGADYVPLLIGSGFDGTSDIIKLLALYPFLMGLSGIGADILRAVGRQKTRIALLATSAALMVPAVWAGAVLGGLVGAAVARLLLQLALVGSTWAFLGEARRSLQPAE
ncbi:oligosaccharide flippase family protein [Stappia sp. F7233]|uniref:Oligosaccharide flippase family protein n=1 Tax=Stappia albiluteola TaxID=2758565 RepID=A0A839AB33_9HYPH|nr:oligosaccharide flippase family protein [Stappia albiluteola]MBA5775929.1 oligosaccharide flippase family protein [Stappia albiluteola]